MSESDGEQVARSVALEQAYVHEVYEQCAEKTVQSRHWPRIYQFLEELEPGALVCDIGNFTDFSHIVQSPLNEDINIYHVEGVLQLCRYSLCTR